MSAVVANLDTSESPSEDSDNETCLPENEMANPPKRSRKEQIKQANKMMSFNSRLLQDFPLGSVFSNWWGIL